MVNKSDNGITTVTLNKPQIHNAFDEYLIQELTKTFRLLNEDKATRVILLNANGKNFSAGADLNWMRRMVNFSREENVHDAMKLVELLQTLISISKPTIALAHGSTLGGGVGLLACCDIVIATETANFCFSEARFGLIPATIAPYIISAMGIRAARYYFITAETFRAHDALRMGLIHKIVPEYSLPIGIEIAESLLQNGPNALVAIKKMLNRFQTIDENLLNETAQWIADARVSPEGQEGLAAFFEKRKPKWDKSVNTA
jgi:methylglutaconyl-CoA hydratase